MEWYFCNKIRYMKKDIFNVIKESEDLGIVEIYGAIGFEYWDGINIKSVQQQLLQIVDCKSIVVRISSFGGNVSEALGIYELLRSLGNKVTTECIGMNASAATIIAMAGHIRRMSKYGFYLIHKCSSAVYGNENEMEAELESQRKVNEKLVQLYVDRTGCDKGKIEELMEADNGNGRWLDIKEAMAYGFITEEIETPADIVEFVKDTMAAIFKERLTKNKKEMNKSIITFAALVALLATNEVEAKDNKAIFDDDQLKKINDALTASDNAKTEAENKLAAAESAKTALETEKANLQAKIAELQAIVDKTPQQEPPAGGSDTQHKGQGESFEDWYNQQPHVKDARRELGL